MSGPIQPTQSTQGDQDLGVLKSYMPPWARKRPCRVRISPSPSSRAMSPPKRYDAALRLSPTRYRIRRSR